MEFKRIVALAAFVGLTFSSVTVAAAGEKEQIDLSAVQLVAPLAPAASRAAVSGRPAVLPALYVSLGALQALDSYSTRSALKAGAREANVAAATNATVATQLQAVYGDAWQASALWGGLFALVGLIVGVAVLVRPAFGDPDQVQAPWIKSVAWAGVSVGFAVG